jgi:hypothetical protein
MDNSDVDEYDFYADLMKTKILRVEFWVFPSYTNDRGRNDWPSGVFFL